MTTTLLKPDDVLSPYDNDATTLVSVTINGVESDLISSYCYDSDILQLGDPFSVVLPDPHQRWKTILCGDPIQLNMSSPLAGGRKVQKVTGIITQIMRTSDEQGGSLLNVAGADLGWHLVNNDAPIWKRLHGGTSFSDLFNKLVDKTWGFKGFRTENDTNIKVKMGGGFQRAVVNLVEGSRPPIVQIEPGDKPADIFIQYAKLAGFLVNVSSDGFFQIFKPNYSQPVAYRFYNYIDRVQAAKQNNVKRMTFTSQLSGIYTKGQCVFTRMLARTEGIDINDPNKDSGHGEFSLSPAPLSFNRLVAFADSDRVSSAQAAARAKWRVQRAAFDSNTYEITVRGHAQNGTFYEADTLCEVYDEYTGIGITLPPLRYVSAVRYNRDRDTGPTTTLQIKQVGLLAA